MERQVAIASGEMCPERGIPTSQRLTRSVGDDSSFGNPGNGTAIKARNRRRGADPPKNESGRIIGTYTYNKSSLAYDRYSPASSGNGGPAPALLSKVFQFAKLATSQIEKLCDCMPIDIDLTYAIAALEFRNDVSETPSRRKRGKVG
jgi:hypothetical protein